MCCLVEDTQEARTSRIVEAMIPSIEQGQLHEATIDSLKRSVRAIISRLDRIEASALTGSRQLVTTARASITASIPEEVTGITLDPFRRSMQLRMNDLGVNFELLVTRFGAEGSDLGEQFAQQQIQALGIDPASLGATGISGSQLSAMTRVLAAEARATIDGITAQLEGDMARVFLNPKATRGQVLQVLQNLLSARRSGGSLRGAIARIAANLRLALGRLFSEANEAVQKAAAEADKNLRKTWVTKGDNLVRTDHNIAGRKYTKGGKPGPIKVAKRFKVGGVTLRFPRDPAATGTKRDINKQIQRCRCDSVIVRIRPKKAAKK